VEFNNLYGLSGSRESKNSDKMVEEFGMHGNEDNLEQIIDWKMGRKESIQKVYVNIGGSCCIGMIGYVREIRNMYQFAVPT